MKTLKDRKHLDSESLKERYLQCFGARVNNATMLQDVVKDLIGKGISRRTLVAWAVAGGYTKGYVSSLLSRILVSLGMRERQKGAGRKPSPYALELLSHARSRYGENCLKVLRAAWRAGKAQLADGRDEAGTARIAMTVSTPFQKAKPNCGTTIIQGAKPAGWNGRNGRTILTDKMKCRRQPRMQRKETASQR